MFATTPAIPTALLATATLPPARSARPPSDSPIDTINAQLGRHLDILNHPGELTTVLTEMNLVWAIIFIIVGALCVLNGYRWHKGIIVVLAGLAGIWAGTVLGAKVGSATIVAACGAMLLALLAWPLLKYSVALFGGLIGAFAGANTWTALGFDPGAHETGAIIGLVLVGMLAFLAFRAVVIVLTTIGGSSLLILGVLAAMLHVSAWYDPIINGLTTKPLIVPIVVASIAAVGAVIQAGGGWKGLSEMADRADPAKSRQQKKAAA